MWEIRASEETNEHRIPINGIGDGIGSFLHISSLLFLFLVTTFIQIYYFYLSFPFLSFSIFQHIETCMLYAFLTGFDFFLRMRTLASYKKREQ